jgi:hypothetical protein
MDSLGLSCQPIFQVTDYAKETKAFGLSSGYCHVSFVFISHHINTMFLTYGLVVISFVSTTSSMMFDSCFYFVNDSYENIGHMNLWEGFLICQGYHEAVVYPQIILGLGYGF